MIKDIEGAIAAEKQYLQDKVNDNLSDKTIYDYLLEFGYNNLKEYRSDKIIYLTKHCGINIIEITSSQIMSDGDHIVMDYFMEHKPHLM